MMIVVYFLVDLLLTPRVCFDDVSNFRIEIKILNYFAVGCYIINLSFFILSYEC